MISSSIHYIYNMNKTISFLLLLLFASLWQPLRAENNYIESDLFASMQAGDKAAVLVVHFGTTHDDTRALTIDAVNRKIAEAFPGIETREAWTSRIIVYRLKARGIEKQSPSEALTQLKEEGFTHILVQSTNIIEGVEMESLRQEVAAIGQAFKEIRIGTPLLYTPADYESVMEALLPKGIQDGAVLLIGHGTYTPPTAQYAMMDYIFKRKGHANYFVGTVEGFPSFEDALSQIRKGAYKKVQLMPFMFVAGEHAKNDIAQDMKGELEQQRYDVSVLMEGLGQNEAIQNLFVEHARFSATHKYLDIAKKKKDYAKGMDKYE